MVIDSYDDFLNAVESPKKVPEWNYYISEERERYILVYRDKNDFEPLFKKYGVDSLVDFQLTFSFENAECQLKMCYNNSFYKNH